MVISMNIDPAITIQGGGPVKQASRDPSDFALQKVQVMP